MFDEVTAFVGHLLTSGADAVAEAIASISKRGQHVLTSDAERMASLAVRRLDKAILVNAIIANIVVMAPIDGAAIRIGLDPTELFEEASIIVGQRGAHSLMLGYRKSLRIAH